MSDRVVIRTTCADKSQLTQADAINFVNQCEQIPSDSLCAILSEHIASLRTELQTSKPEVIESYIHIIYKGLYHKSENAHALRYFLWGYFAREQESVLQTAFNTQKAKLVDVLSSKKHFSEIICYLYENGCSQQQNLVRYLGVNKSNLSRLFKSLVDCGLVVKSTGPKQAFYELSQEGYLYYKQHYASQNLSILQPSQQQLESEVVQIRSKMQYRSIDDNVSRPFFGYLTAEQPRKNKQSRLSSYDFAEYLDKLGTSSFPSHSKEFEPTVCSNFQTNYAF